MSGRPAYAGSGATQIALEGIKEKMKEIWQAIVNAFKKAAKWIRDHINKLFGAQEALQKTAEKSGAHLHLLAGAIAGIDGIAAAKEGGLEKVTYKGCKSPNSWRGSYAEKLIDLDNVKEATVFYKGTAREAALKFPANANVAATIALAGIGMDETQVELTVDPNISQNKHTIVAEGRFGQMSIEMIGVPLESNPKTSTLAALSVIRACRNSVDAIQI